MMSPKHLLAFTLATVAFASAKSSHAQWTGANSLHSESTTCFAEDQGVLYAGFSMFGVCRSSDSGFNWKVVSSGLPLFGPNYYVSALASIGPNLFAASAGVYC